MTIWFSKIDFEYLTSVTDVRVDLVMRCCGGDSLSTLFVMCSFIKNRSHVQNTCFYGSSESCFFTLLFFILQRARNLRYQDWHVVVCNHLLYLICVVVFFWCISLSFHSVVCEEFKHTPGLCESQFIAISWFDGVSVLGCSFHHSFWISRLC